MTQPTPRNPTWRLLLWLFEAAVALILVIDAIARPLYRPLMDWVAGLQIMRRFAAAIAPLPRFVILVLFAVPFAIAEPAKVFALLLIARGLTVSGIVLLIVSYLVTFLIVERIYEAGREKLLTYIWFAWAMTKIGYVRDILLEIRARAMLRWKEWLQGTRSPK